MEDDDIVNRSPPVPTLPIIPVWEVVMFAPLQTLDSKMSLASLCRLM